MKSCKLKLICAILIFCHIYVASPNYISINEDLPTQQTNENDPTEVPIENELQIYKMQVKINISNRFAQTTVVYKIRNLAGRKNVDFPIFIPDNAFISELILEVDGENRTAYVEEADHESHPLIRLNLPSLQSHEVDFAFQNSYRFPISIKFSPRGTAAFYLTYQELLVQKDNKYEIFYNIKPGQPVEDLSIEVLIDESDKIQELKVLPLRPGHQNGNNSLEADPLADISVLSDTSVLVKFSLNLERQKELAHLFQTSNNEGFLGQFILQYDLERNSTVQSEILIKDGYFVHFYSPKTEIKTRPKHTVFVLDTSETMKTQNLQEVKESMGEILELLPDGDLFTLIESKKNAKVWNLDNIANSISYQSETDLKSDPFPIAYLASNETIKKALNDISGVTASGEGDIYNALQVSLELLEEEKKGEVDGIDRQCVVILITSGDVPTQNSSTEIINTIFELNSASVKCPIFTLSFGTDAEKYDLRKLSLKNYGLLVDISEAGDGSTQIVNIYKEITKLLLTDIAFDYGQLADTASKTRWPAYYRGSELFTVGTYGPSNLLASPKEEWDTEGPFIVKKSKTDLERLWAHVTIKQLIEQIRVTTDEDEEDALIDEATSLSLKYSLVTDFTTSVLPKPEVILRSLIIQPNKRTNIQRPHPIRRKDKKKKPKKSAKSILLSKLSWLKTKIDAQELLSLPILGKYKLGLNETINDKPDCPKTPLNAAAGHCALLKDCSQIYSLLTSFDALVEHFCVLKNEYAGVCCPNS